MKGVFINMKTAFDFYESNKKEINKNLIDIIIYSVMSNYIDLEDKKTCVGRSISANINERIKL